MATHILFKISDSEDKYILIFPLLAIKWEGDAYYEVSHN